MRIRYIISAIGLGSLLAIGCDRKNVNIQPPRYPEGGLGGKATLRITPRHHLKNIDNSTVYIKYNTKLSSDVFDDSARTQIIDGRPIAIFNGLKRGDYYLYATGYNDEIQDSIKLVTGGGGFSVIDSVEKSYDIYLDVFSVYE